MTTSMHNPHQTRGQASSGLVDDSLPSSLSSTSLSSSFSSSAASSMLLAAPPSNSSRSEIIQSDHSATSPSTTTKDLIAAVSPAPRSSSLALVMGQNYSRATPPGSVTSTTSSALTSRGFAAAAATGFKLKRAFAARRKKSEDISAPSSHKHDQRKERERSDISINTQVDPASSSTTSSPRLPTGNKPFTQLASHVFKRNPKSPISSLPPQPPPKPAGLQPAKKPTPAPISINEPRQDPRASLIPVSPSISSALDFMRMGEHQRERERIAAQQKHKEKDNNDLEKVDSKDSWRKSDSTMSYHTIRPGAGVGSRASRPVSMADSLQSNHTIVPVNKRLSAIVIDAEFAMAEEDDSVRSSEDGLSSPATVAGNRISPASSLRSRNRRSMSLNISSTFYSNAQGPSTPTSASTTELRSPPPTSKSFSEGSPIPPSMSRETPTLTRAAANGIIAPSSAGIQSTGNNIRGRLAAWTAATNASAPSPHQERSLPALPPTHPHRTAAPPSNRAQPPSMRQTAISMTSGFAPAAGLAKRAVEKMGRAWGGMNSSSSNSGYSSSSSGNAPSSYSNTSITDHSSVHTHSNQSTPGFFATPSHTCKGKQRRTPNAPSGSWSIASSATSSSLSDSDAFSSPAGPTLGTQLRGSVRRTNSGAGVAGGVVFGRDLEACTRETAVDPLRSRSGASMVDRARQYDKKGSFSGDDVYLKVLETRKLPALVVRCAQHILLWGVQEEGLFR